jgi:protein-tyrosine kinase
MVSKVQMVLEAEKKRNAAREPKSQSIGQAAKEFVASSGIFKALSPAFIKPVEMESNKILPAIDDRRAVTAYKMLRTRVLQRMRSNDWHTLIVSSAGPSEGKTLTACNLAVSVSNDVNQSVILVDLDLQRPTLAAYFGLDVKAGIGDYLADSKVSIDDIAYAPDGMDRILIVPNREPVPNSSDLLASPRMRSFLAWAKSHGPETITIFDMPPVLACDDVLAFSPYTDAILMIVAEGATERRSLARTMEMIGDRNLLGVVLNKSREKHAVSAYY